MTQRKSTDQIHSPSVLIEKLVPGGDGLGHMDRGVVFVPLTAPGDIVTLKNVRKRRGVWFAEPDDLVESSPERKEPPCPWFGECGGCQWMHMDYDEQLLWKEDIFSQALVRIAHLQEPPPLLVHPSPAEFQYRFRARLQIKGGDIGFFRRASNSVVSWERCMQLPEALNRAAGELQAWFRENRAPAALKSCEAALSPVDGSMTLCWSFNSNKDISNSVRTILDGVEKRMLSGDLTLAGQAAYDKWGKSVAARGKSLNLEVSGVRMPASPGTFFQVNPQVNAMLVGRVLEHLRSTGASSLLDLYCGNGNFSLPAAAAGIMTVGVETSPQAVRDALSVAGPSSRFIEMDAGRYLAREREHFDAVIVDPPRTGLPGAVLEILEERHYPFLIYVSCEPATLARDLARLTRAGYAVSIVELFDMFPQTSHSETLVVLRG